MKYLIYCFATLLVFSSCSLMNKKDSPTLNTEVNTQSQVNTTVNTNTPTASEKSDTGTNPMGI